MIVMICVDDHNGMMFNHRRQSRDSAVQERVLRCSETVSYTHLTLPTIA